MSKKILGVIGGMGAQASAGFYNTVIESTYAKNDQDHIEMLIYSKTSIPDRTDAIKKGKSEEVVKSLQEAYDRLNRAGADYVVMTCNTAHYFINELNFKEETQFINMLEVTVDSLSENGFRKVGLMATDGTIYSKVYEKKLQDQGIELIVPNKDQQLVVMDMIYQYLKIGHFPPEEYFTKIASDLLDRGAEAIILGCTELSYFANFKKLGKPYVDPQKILARKCIILCGGTLLEEYYE